MKYSKPVNFNPAVNVTSVRFTDEPPPFLRRPVRRGRKRQGILYEQKALAYLCERFDGQFKASPWIIFTCAGSAQERWCQPDGVLVDPEKGRLIVTEIKLRHCAEAWFQMFQLYMPVLEHLFPGWVVAGCEVCKWFDPVEVVPAAPKMRENPMDAVKGEFNVHIWSP